MTPRVKWLLMGGLVVVGLYFMDSLYRKWIEQPTQQLTAQLEDLAEKLGNGSFARARIANETVVHLRTLSSLDSRSALNCFILFDSSVI
jgi:hypothetical protein